jgi:hypothetical protein
MRHRGDVSQKLMEASPLGGQKSQSSCTYRVPRARDLIVQCGVLWEIWDAQQHKLYMQEFDDYTLIIIQLQSSSSSSSLQNPPPPPLDAFPAILPFQPCSPNTGMYL